MTTTFVVDPQGADWYYCAVIERPDGETDYLDGFAAGEKPTVTGLREHSACRHAWVAGMMYVHDEDLDSVSANRKPRLTFRGTHVELDFRHYTSFLSPGRSKERG